MFPGDGLWDAIDPGVDYYAVATFVGPALMSACVIPIADISRVDRPLVIELAQIYQRSGVRQADIADLLFATGYIAAHYKGGIRKVRPAEWKGQVPKKIHHPRIKQSLVTHERAIIDGMNKGDLKHVMDAIGIGLFACGRMVP